MGSHIFQMVLYPYNHNNNNLLFNEIRLHRILINNIQYVRSNNILDGKVQGNRKDFKMKKLNPSKVFYTIILSAVTMFILSFILCMLNVGLLIEGYIDDQIIGILLIITSITIGWYIANHVFSSKENLE